MGEIIFGLLLLVAGVISFLTVRRAAAKGERILRDWAPNSDMKVLRVGPRFRWAFTFACLVLGSGFIVFGLVK
jgi:hypothetical protein